jgi:hypothetical protein
MYHFDDGLIVGRRKRRRKWNGSEQEENKRSMFRINWHDTYQSIKEHKNIGGRIKQINE